MASLQLLFDLKIIPSIALTNDWLTSLTPVYEKKAPLEILLEAQQLYTFVTILSPFMKEACIPHHKKEI